MATWKDENEKQDYTLRQVLKEIDTQYNLDLLFRDDYILEDELKDNENDN